MKKPTMLIAVLPVLASFCLVPVSTAAERKMQNQPPRGGGAMTDTSGVDVSSWPERPRLAAVQMMAKYGSPQEATAHHLIWHNAGPYKKITLMKTEVPHDFPKPHMDFLKHTVAYQVPVGKANDLYEFDGAVTFDRNAGELSARCDLESHNILALNLAQEIITGKKSTSAARKAFTEAIMDDTMGKTPPVMAALQFQPMTGAMGDPDKTTIPGSSQRAPMGERLTMTGRDSASDSEILGSLVALNDNEIGAAAEAKQKKVSAEIMAYAKMLHEQHGQNQMETMKLGQKIKATPVETAAVDQMRTKAAGELAGFAGLDGDEFGKAYIQAMVKGHQEALDMIDNKWLPAAQNAETKQHLTTTRGHIAHHLEEAKRLSGR